MRALLGAVIVSLAALALPAQAQQAPRGMIVIPGNHGGQLPPHIQSCFNEMGVYQGFTLFRLAGLSKEEAEVSLGFTMRILAYRVEQSGKPPKQPLEDVRADSQSKLDEIYAIEPFSEPIMQAWASEKMDACVEANAPPEAAPRQDQRLIPPKRGA